NPDRKPPMSRLILPALFVAFAATACTGKVEDTRPGQPVKHRQDAFKAITRAFEPMGVMLRTDAYNADNFAAAAAELIRVRETPWSYFGPDTHYPPTKAKAAVWSEAADFERERVAFFTASDALLAAAQTGDKAQVQAAYDVAYDSCKSCHKRFKD